MWMLFEKMSSILQVKGKDPDLNLYIWDRTQIFFLLTDRKLNHNDDFFTWHSAKYVIQCLQRFGCRTWGVQQIPVIFCHNCVTSAGDWCGGEEGNWRCCSVCHHRSRTSTGRIVQPHLLQQSTAGGAWHAPLVKIEVCQLKLFISLPTLLCINPLCPPLSLLYAQTSTQILQCTLK